MAAPDRGGEGVQGGAADCIGDWRDSIAAWKYRGGSGTLDPTTECGCVESMVSDFSGQSGVGVSAQIVADVRGGICVCRIIRDGGYGFVVAETMG